MTLPTKFLFFSIAILLASEADAETPVRLRVLSYNIHHGEGVDRQLDLERIAEVILSVKPDLVALQEVDRKMKRTNNVDQPAELARLTDMNVVFGANIALQGGHYGNAILSRFPISAHRNHLLPRLNDGEQRGVLAADIAAPSGDGPILFLATHFDHRRDDRERVLSAKALNGIVEHHGRAAILVGDLNDVVGSEALNELDSMWNRTNDDPLPTIPVAEPKRQIDFILVRPAGRWKVMRTQVLEEAIASDHRAILAVLELQPEK